MFIAEEIRACTLYLIASYKCTREAPCVAWQVRECILHYRPLHTRQVGICDGVYLCINNT